MSHPALQYAETTLGVHQVYEEGREALSNLERATENLVGSQAKRRWLDDQIENREMDLLIEERGKHPDHSEAAFQRHLKEVFHKDDELRRMRDERAALVATVAACEAAVDSCKHTLKFVSARMEELGGYLNYLAAVKNAEATAPPSPAQTTA